MKRSAILAAALLFAVSGAYAQRDDMYYRPSKKADAANDVAAKEKQPIVVYNNNTYNNSDVQNNFTDEEIDAYNRRYAAGDTLYLGDGDSIDASGYGNSYDDGYDDGYANDYECTCRLMRFHSPSLSLFVGVGSPFYWNYYDYIWGWGLYDPWYYDAYWGWNVGWYYPYYYGWGWHYRPWYNWAWHRPWHSIGWQGGGGRYFAGNIHSSRVGSAGGRIWTSGRNFRDANRNAGQTYNSNRYNRFSGTYDRNSVVRSYSNRNNVRRSNQTSNRTTSNNNSLNSRPSTSTRSFGSGSSTRSFRSTGGNSFRSGGMGGGTRSFGGGGGGGRRR